MVIRNSLGDAGNYEEITPSSAIGITASLFKDGGRPAKAAYISVQDAAISFTLEGTTPTNVAGTDDGHPLAVGDSLILEGINNIRNFLCIDQAGASKVKVTLYY